MRDGILVSSPDLRPSLMSILKGLCEESLLDGLVTTLAFDRAKACGKIAASVCRILPKKIRSALERRFLPDYFKGRVDTLVYREILRLLAAASGNRILAHRVWLWSELEFDKQVARRFAGWYRCIYGMEHSSLETFRRQKASGGLCILRQVMAHGRVALEVTRSQLEAYKEYADERATFFLQDMHRSLDRKEEEYRLADLIMVNSNFVKDTFIKCGIDKDKIASVPTGCPGVAHTAARSGTGAQKLIFLFAGRLSLRKGLIYLIEAWRMLNAGNHAELWLVGQREVPEELLKKNISGIRYFGALSSSELPPLYARADVFVLPTLLEGLAYVVLEALSAGLPVITTRESGCGTFVNDGVNGIIVESADSQSLRSAMEWAIKNRARLPDMGKASLEQARSWTLEDSNRAHLKVIRDFLENK